MIVRKSLISLIAFILVAQAAVAIAQSKDWMLGPFIRPVSEPVISPTSDTNFYCPAKKQTLKWESSDTFNPAAVMYKGDICVLYRAEDGSGSGIGTHTSRVGLARSKDGINFVRNKKPVLYPDNDQQKAYEWFGGCEDPRVVEGPDGTFFIYYTMWNRGNPFGEDWSVRIGVASSRDLEHWTKHGPIFDNKKSIKTMDIGHKASSVVTKIQDGRLVATKINGKFWMYWGEDKVQLAYSDDLISWYPVLDDSGVPVKIIEPREGKFDSMLTECGPPAILTEKGIVLIYNGKNAGDDTTISKGAYAAGQILLDKNDPVKLLDRCDTYFFSPELDFEKTGQYPQGTVFVEGLVYNKDKWYLYYGTADSFVGVAVYSSK